MKVIKLTTGEDCKVCDCHYDLVKDSKWCVLRNSGYARRGVRSRLEGWQKTILMHRQIMNAPNGLVVDHINGDSLDNRCSNLRLCTQGQNTANRTKRNKNNTTGYQGVYYIRGNSKHIWGATIMFRRKGIFLGSYLTKEEAAVAYNYKAKELFGEFATINKIGN